MLSTLLCLLEGSAATQIPSLERESSERLAKHQREALALEAVIEISPKAKVLRAQANTRLEAVIGEAAKTNDQRLIPHLKVLTADRKERAGTGGAAVAAHIALVRLGDAEAFAEIVAELEAAESRVQEGAILKLVRVGSPAAYRKLYELLDDQTPLGEDSPDEISKSKSMVVMDYLRLNADSPPLSTKGNYYHYEVDVWKAWLVKNKNLNK